MLDWQACPVFVEYMHGAVVHGETISVAIRWGLCRIAPVVASVIDFAHLRLGPSTAKTIRRPGPAESSVA